MLIPGRLPALGPCCLVQTTPDPLSWFLRTHPVHTSFSTIRYIIGLFTNSFYPFQEYISGDKAVILSLLFVFSHLSCCVWHTATNATAIIYDKLSKLVIYPIPKKSGKSPTNFLLRYPLPEPRGPHRTSIGYGSSILVSVLQWRHKS